MTYRWLPHTADLRLEIEAPNLDGLLRDGVEVLRRLVVGSSEVRATHDLEILVPADPPSDTLLTLLREMLYRFDTERFVPGEVVRIERRGDQLAVALSGEAFDPARHEAQPELKAITRHQLAVTHTDAGLLAHVVFDV